MEINELGHDNVYKYLGIEESDKIEHGKMKEKLSKEFMKRVKLILKSELHPKNKITALRTLAIPVLTYSFGVVDWNQRDLNKLDGNIRKMLHAHKLMYKNQCQPRMYISRNDGGMGVPEIDVIYKEEIISLNEYLNGKDERLIRLVREHEHRNDTQKTIPRKAADYISYVGMEQEVENLAGDNLQTRMKLLREKYKRARSRMKMDRWREHAYAKHYKIEVYDKVFVDKEATMEMLTKGILAENDERLVIAAQDQALRTNWFRKNIEGDNNISEMCRLCKAKPETVGHIIAGCETLLHRGSYTERHNSVCALIHYRLCKKYGINLEANNHWAYTPAPIQENNEVLILYDVGIPTAIFVPNIIDRIL